MNPRVVAAAQILIVTAGVYAAVFGLAHAGIGAGGTTLSPTPGMVVHVLVLAGSSLGLAWIALVKEPSRIEALGLGLGPVRGRVPLVIMFGLAGGVATYGVNAIVSLGYILSTGGIEKHLDLAKQNQEAFAAFAAIPLWVMVPLAFVAGAYEDIVFRGFLLGRLRILFATPQSRFTGDALSVVVSSLIFGLGHTYQGWFGVMKTTVAGVCLAILVLLTRSVWPAIIAHAGIDTASLIALHFLSPFVDKALQNVKP